MNKLDKVVTDNRLAHSYADEFKRLAAKLDELDNKALTSMEPPAEIFKVLADAAKDLSEVLEVLEGERLQIVGQAGFSPLWSHPAGGTDVGRHPA